MARPKDHERIWLEPAGAPDRCWCEDNQWGDEGVKYIRATTAEAQLAVAEAAADSFHQRMIAAEAQVAALTKRAGELEGALEPFADAADDAERHSGHDGPMGQYVSLEYIRAARTALEPKP